MLPITIPPGELYDEEKNQFYNVTKEQKIVLEHSLLSISKWESKWKKPYLDPDVEKTREESIDYIRCMTITQNVDPSVYYNISADNMAKINAYINDSMTATWFTESESQKKKISREKVTSELIYYWMISLGIPLEICEKWHINRLFTLIEIFNVKNAADNKVSPKQTAMERTALNAQRRAKLKTRG